MYQGEKLNAISHLVGAALSLVGLGALLTVSLQSGNPWQIFSFAVFGISLVLLYTMSTLYHSFRANHVKRVFKLLDHVAIYILIAGTYTPYMLLSLRGDSGWIMLAVVWTLALIGIVSELLLKGRLVKVGQMLIFLGMGWACAFDYASLEAALPPPALTWLAAGGIAYTAGVVFYVLDKFDRLAHAHGIWHFFVVAGSVAHFVSVIGYVR